MRFYRVFANSFSQREIRSGKFARNAYVTFLCLFYLVSNTAVFPSLSQGNSCRCAEQTQANSECCCFNKTLGNKSSKAKSSCANRKQAKRSCCSDRNKQQSTSQNNSKRCQVLSLCSCNNSANEGLHSLSPRDLNPSPVLLTPDSLTIQIAIADVSPVTFDCAPETPPPQRLS
ncbi:MAG: hypothetical protein QM501_14840 [Gimesia sp.]